MVSDARARRVMGDAVRGRGRRDRAVMGRVERARAREGARGGRLATMTGTVMVEYVQLQYPPTQDQPDCPDTS